MAAHIYNQFIKSDKNFRFYYFDKFSELEFSFKYSCYYYRLNSNIHLNILPEALCLYGMTAYYTKCYARKIA